MTIEWVGGGGGVEVGTVGLVAKDEVGVDWFCEVGVMDFEEFVGISWLVVGAVKFGGVVEVDRVLVNGVVGVVVCGNDVDGFVKKRGEGSVLRKL